MLNNEKSDRPLGKQDYIGWAMWATGMFFEVLADYQKSAFRNDPNNQVLGFPAGLSRPGKSREGPGTGRDRTGPRNPEGPMVLWSRD